LLNGTFYCTTWMQKMVQQHYAECRVKPKRYFFHSAALRHYKNNAHSKNFQSSRRIRRWSVWGQSEDPSLEHLRTG
jgi:hypothetical protein